MDATTFLVLHLLAGVMHSTALRTSALMQEAPGLTGALVVSAQKLNLSLNLSQHLDQDRLQGLAQAMDATTFLVLHLLAGVMHSTALRTSALMQEASGLTGAPVVSAQKLNLSLSQA
jgi:predicted protein tyrosine phosphatase